MIRKYKLFICKICKNNKPHLSYLDSDLKVLTWCNDCQTYTKGKWINLYKEYK